MSGITLKREDIGNCRRCGTSPKGEKFEGNLNIECCTHMHSHDGWWLRIDHGVDVFKKDHPRKPDVVGELLCPSCAQDHDDSLKEILDF